MKPKLNPYIVLIIGLMAASSAATLIGLAQRAGAPSLVIAAFRLVIATLVLGLVVLYRGSWRQLLGVSPRVLLLIVLSGLMLGAHFASWITSIEVTSVTNAVVFVKTTPLWVGLFAPFALKEATRRITWLSIIVVMFGAVIIALSSRPAEAGSSSVLLGDGLALLSAFFVACYLMIGRSIREKLDLIPYLFAVYGIASFSVLSVVGLLRLPIATLRTDAFVWMVALGLFPQLIGHSAFNYAMRHMQASLVTIIQLGDTLPQVFLAAIFLADVPTPLQAVGAVIVLLGILIATLFDYRQKQLKAVRLARTVSGE